MMRIVLGADHAGFESKETLKRWLAERGHHVEDLGTYSAASVDYPDFACHVARRVAEGKVDRGVLICGTGIGMSIAANKIRGVRAAHCTDPYQARMAREHNDANVLCMGSRISGPGVMEATLETFLESSFAGERHVRRIEKIRRMDEGIVDDPEVCC
jgi:ribose 5-phosphate isomerase B